MPSALLQRAYLLCDAPRKKRAAKTCCSRFCALRALLARALPRFLAPRARLRLLDGEHVLFMLAAPHAARRCHRACAPFV